MIRYRFVFFLAIVSASLAVISRHAVTIEDLIGSPGVIENTLPASGTFIFAAIVLVLLSVIPFGALFSARKEADDSRRAFAKQDLDSVATHIDALANEARPDVPLMVDYTIFQAISAGASDIHFDPVREGFAIRFRVDGMMIDVVYIPQHLTTQIANRLKVLSNLVVYEGFRPQDGRLGSEKTGKAKDDEKKQRGGADFRIAFMPTLHGERIVIRILGRSGDAFDFADLGMNQRQQKQLAQYVSQPQGMIVLTGPTGSGKTTTIYAALRSIQDQGNAVRSISTLEDPIEYEISGINQSQVNEKKGFTFDKGLRAVLRQDPDVIMVGEIRDSETAKIAIQSGMTGHLIITTVHANSSAATFSRLLEMGVAPYSLNSAVTAVIAQRLVRRICLGCRTARPISAAEAQALGLDEVPPDFQVFEGKGCAGCEGSGYSGRYALYEFLEVTESVRTLVAEQATADVVYAKAREEGMTNLADAGVIAVSNGITTPEEIIRSVFRDNR